MLLQSSMFSENIPFARKLSPRELMQISHKLEGVWFCYDVHKEEARALKKWRETLAIISCFTSLFFQAPLTFNDYTCTYLDLEECNFLTDGINLAVVSKKMKL